MRKFVINSKIGNWTVVYFHFFHFGGSMDARSTVTCQVFLIGAIVLGPVQLNATDD